MFKITDITTGGDKMENKMLVVALQRLEAEARRKEVMEMYNKARKEARQRQEIIHN